MFDRKLLLPLTVLFVATLTVVAVNNVPNLQANQNATGVAQTFNTAGALNLNNEFFQSLGTNGRSCVSCHQVEDGWSITPEHVQKRFVATDGMDPIFRPNDGANCPAADVSTVEARRAAYSMLLNRGVIRVSLPIPANAEFQLERVDDPYDCSNENDLALFRRPLPATNLRFLSAVMWDGRESPKGQSLHDSLMNQANDATLGHAQGTGSLTRAQAEKIVQFEVALSSAQILDTGAGQLSTEGGNGGAVPLSKQTFFIGINDPLGQNPTGAAFDPVVFRLFEKWKNLADNPKDKTTTHRKAVAHGEELFNSLPITIEGVAGLNDELGVTAIPGTCTTCHDSPNVGNHSVAAPLNIGLVDEERRTPDMPLYTLRCISTRQVYKVTDPGRALITGKCKDIGRFKGPVLRGLASRAPYFHNGSAATLRDVVDFYDSRFHLALSEKDKHDLVAFLQSL
jgi:cytochrome c peroxidase